MNLREELLIGKPLEPGQETILAVLLTREYLARLADEQLFKPEGITDQQYNLLRILKGGPGEGYLLREIRPRMIARNADVPRLVDRLQARGLVQRTTDPVDRRGCRVRITSEGMALENRLAEPLGALHKKLEKLLPADETATLWRLLECLRDGIREAFEDKPQPTDPAPRPRR
jgi:DNA-binding MarR family transcriptional regulator